MRHAAVESHDAHSRGQPALPEHRGWLPTGGLTAQHQQMAGLAERRRGLVHEAAGSARHAVLGLLRQQRQAQRVQVEVPQRRERAQGRDLQGGRRRHAGPRRHVAPHEEADAARAEQAGCVEHGEGAEDVGRPVRAVRLQRGAQAFGGVRRRAVVDDGYGHARLGESVAPPIRALAAGHEDAVVGRLGNHADTAIQRQLQNRRAGIVGDPAQRVESRGGACYHDGVIGLEEPPRYVLSRQGRHVAPPHPYFITR